MSTANSRRPDRFPRPGDIFGRERMLDVTHVAAYADDLDRISATRENDAIESTLTRARASMRDLLTGCIELEQPFCVDSERDEWREWAEDRIDEAELVAMEMRFGIDDEDGSAHHGPYGAQYGAYVGELETLLARVRRAIGAAE